MTAVEVAGALALMACDQRAETGNDMNTNPTKLHGEGLDRHFAHASDAAIMGISNQNLRSMPQ